MVPPESCGVERLRVQIDSPVGPSGTPNQSEHKRAQAVPTAPKEMLIPAPKAQIWLQHSV
jgi:hypothetical protein